MKYKISEEVEKQFKKENALFESMFALICILFVMISGYCGIYYNAFEMFFK